MVIIWDNGDRDDDHEIAFIKTPRVAVCSVDDVVCFVRDLGRRWLKSRVVAVLVNSDWIDGDDLLHPLAQFVVENAYVWSDTTAKLELNAAFQAAPEPLIKVVLRDMARHKGADWPLIQAIRDTRKERR